VKNRGLKNEYINIANVTNELIIGELNKEFSILEEFRIIIEKINLKNWIIINEIEFVHFNLTLNTTQN
jgi:hypothetical protein